jgi:hypothetical protein
VLLQLKNAGIDGSTAASNEKGGNAFRHCLATCQAVKTCGDASAKRFWDGRETSTDIDGRQDLANNSVGYGLASNSSCWDACINAWNTGKLTWPA